MTKAFTLPVIVVRPEPGCGATVEAARALGLDAHGFPLFAVEPVAWDPPPPGEIDAVLIGSANALRHGGADLAIYRGKPAYAVGRTSAEAAGRAGFAPVVSGNGGLQDMLSAIDPAHRRLLRLAGDVRVPLDVPEGITLTERVVYASRPLPLPAGLSALLAEPALVLLHSGEAARHFATLCEKRDHIALAAIGPRVAAMAGTGWRDLRTAATPDDTAMLALAREMCQERGRPGQFQDGT